MRREGLVRYSPRDSPVSCISCISWLNLRDGFAARAFADEIFDRKSIE